jgi:hypothetical protein
MADFSDQYGGKFLAAKHLVRPMVGVVRDVLLEEMSNGERPKPVMYLEGIERGIVLNASRYDAMAALTGSRDTDDWQGTKVIVRKGTTRFAGKVVDCVELAPAQKNEPAEADSIMSEVPF